MSDCRVDNKNYKFAGKYNINCIPDSHLFPHFNLLSVQFLLLEYLYEPIV